MQKRILANFSINCIHKYYVHCKAKETEVKGLNTESCAESSVPKGVFTCYKKKGSYREHQHFLWQQSGRSLRENGIFCGVE